MADVVIDPGAGGATIHTVTRTGKETQVVGLDLTPGGGAETLMNGVMPVSDNGGSLTVDAPVGTPVFVRLSDGTSAIVTLPISAASLPLPAGAATTAKQPALGTAGAASADVISIQGIASMTPLLVNGSGVTQPVSGPLTDTQLRATPVPVSGTVTASGPLTDAQLRATSVPVTADTELPAAAALGDGAANPTTPTVGAAGLLWNGTTWDRAKGDTTNGAFVNVKTSVLPTGASTAAKQPALGTAGAASADVVTIQGVASMTAVKVDPSGVTSPVSLASLPALAAGSALAARVNLDPQTANGLSIFHLVSAATTNATNLKASAGQVYGWYIYNSNAAARKVAFHNTAGTPTAGASVIFAIVIPPLSAANVFSEMALAFATGIAITTVTDLTDAGTTAVAASDLVINIFFK